MMFLKQALLEPALLEAEIEDEATGLLRLFIGS